MPLTTRSRAPIMASPLANRRIRQHLAHEISNRTDAIVKNVQREPWWPRTSTLTLGGQQLLCQVLVFPCRRGRQRRTVDARTLGSSLSMASCRRVISTSGSFSRRPRNASNTSSGNPSSRWSCGCNSGAPAPDTACHPSPPIIRPPLPVRLTPDHPAVLRRRERPSRCAWRARMRAEAAGCVI